MVGDNGIGMSRDDAMLAIERYATSKIYHATDLFSIKTLGFRGEALPSIASVSRFCLVTREKGSDTATAIYVEGGKLKKVAEAGAPAGTMITVKHLFFNTPARRKFMKSIATEMGHIADSVSRMALGWPGVNFQLYHNGKHVKSWSATSDPLTRVSEVLGSGIKGRLHEIEAASNGYRISGWLCDPRIFRNTSRSVFIYINGRFVKDRIIQHALFEGCSGRLIKGQFPLAVLFISVPYDRVDVNVHPTKSQVRFTEQNTVYELVKAAVSRALKRADRSGWTIGSIPSENRQPSGMDTLQVSETSLRFHKTAPEAGGSAFGLKARESFTRNVETALQQENLRLTTQAQVLTSLREENNRLRELLGASPQGELDVVFCELVRIDLDPYSHRVIINRGSRHGIATGQPVVDAHGVFGQVERVSAGGAQVILISDPDHALPVQINRTGLRTLAYGSGHPQQLVLPDLPLNTDIQAGDLIVTSGLGGRFIAGSMSRPAQAFPSMTSPTRSACWSANPASRKAWWW
ncbi:TPA: rod shape-determining protein MreC [Candidatus Micrarchaeota archaeon]|nr:rod shape-determining protein MreC [Candidatus Micrarchaeota archaeon]